MYDLHEEPPRKVTAQFEHLVNTLAVETDAGWAYYPMRVDTACKNSNYMTVIKGPKVLADGILALAGKNYFDVSMRDLVRRRVDVRKTSTHVAIIGAPTVIDSTPVDESGAGQDDWDKECKAANLAYQEQIKALQRAQNS